MPLFEIIMTTVMIGIFACGLLNQICNPRKIQDEHPWTRQSQSPWLQ